MTTRKAITGRLMGLAPTSAPIRIEAIDIVRIRDERYAQHWGINSLPAVLASLRAAQG